MAEVSVFLTVAYDGAPFHGFARQPGLPTVQGALEDALAVALRRPVAISVAGRTDAGVHATGQVVSFRAHSDEVSDLAALLRSTDAMTPPGIGVSRPRLAASQADARFSALARRYRYRIATGRPRPVLAAQYVWCRRRALDVDAMRGAAAALVGEHDFRSFCVVASGDLKSTVREIARLDIVEEDLLGTPVLGVEIEGPAFLHSMVRIVVGTLVEVGRGARSAEYVARALQARERAAAGPTAPAHGLVLEGVRYPDAIFLDAEPPGR